jgi:hypothetical protein
MNVLICLYIALLFFILTPGILLSIPSRGSKTVVAVTHAVVFAVVYNLTHNLVLSLTEDVMGLSK